MHVVFAPLGGLDDSHRRHRTSGVAGEEEDVVRLDRRRRSCQPEMNDHGCIHLNNFKAAKGIQPYKVIHSFFVTSTSTEARVRKVRLSFFRVLFVVKVLCFALFVRFFLAPLRSFPLFSSLCLFILFYLFLLVHLTLPLFLSMMFNA